MDDLPIGDLATPPEVTAVARPFGVPRYWLNTGPDERLPLRERRLQPGPLTLPVPPRPQRLGLVPRLGVTAEWRDNVFRTAEDTRSDAILTASPGFSWIEQGSQWAVFADYALESALHLEVGDLSDGLSAQSASVGGTYNPSRRTTLTLFNSFVETRDVGEALIPQALPPFSTIRTNAVVATAEHRPTARSEIRAFYENQLQFSDAENTSEIVVHGGGAEFAYEIGPADRLTARYLGRAFAFSESDDAHAHEGFVQYEREFGERFAVRAAVGAIGTGADGGRVFPQIEGSISASMRDLLFTVGASRDLLPAVGVEDLVLSTEVSANLLTRLAPGLQVEARVEHRWLTVLDGVDTTIDSTAVEGRLSYAIADNLWIWAGYGRDRDATEDSVTTSNRVLVGLVRTFPF